MWASSGSRVWFPGGSNYGVYEALGAATIAVSMPTGVTYLRGIPLCAWVGMGHS